MNEISPINVSHLNNGAHFLFLSNILARAEADETVRTKAAAQVDALKAAVAQEDTDLKLSRKSLLSDKIAEADKRRGRLYMAYKKAVNGLLGFRTGEIGEAAQRLAQHLKDYAIRPKMQLDRETGLLVNFLADLEEKYAGQVERLGLATVVAGLKEANEQVRLFTGQRTEQRMTMVTGALSASRKRSDNAYRQLVRMVNALSVVEGRSAYAPFIDYANAEIIHYKREALAPQSSPEEEAAPAAPSNSPKGEAAPSNSPPKSPLNSPKGGASECPENEAASGEEALESSEGDEIL